MKKNLLLLTLLLLTGFIATAEEGGIIITATSNKLNSGVLKIKPLKTNLRPWLSKK